MKIVDLIQLLDNRLKEFKLSRDYARMSGNLDRMNMADKEVISLEDTLYQLNLLVDTSKSAAVKKATLAEVITDGSIAVLDEYDITPYATDPKHEEKIMNILSKMGVMDTVEKIDDYINGKYWRSGPVTGEMVMNAALAYDVDVRLMMAIMEQDSSFGTAGKAVRTLNPGNVGNDDSGNLRTYESWQEGVTAVAEWLNRHRGSTIISETPEETVLEPVATSTPPITIPTSTTTPATLTSITTPATATSTSPITIPTATTTPVTTATSTPTTISTTTTTTTTPATIPSTPATSTPVTTATSTPTTISTTTTATTTPVTATSTPVTATSTPATSTPVTTATSTPITTSTTTTATTTATSTTTPETTIEEEKTATSTTSTDSSN